MEEGCLNLVDMGRASLKVASTIPKAGGPELCKGREIKLSITK